MNHFLFFQFSTFEQIIEFIDIKAMVTTIVSAILLYSGRWIYARVAKLILPIIKEIPLWFKKLLKKLKKYALYFPFIIYFISFFSIIPLDKPIEGGKVILALSNVMFCILYVFIVCLLEIQRIKKEIRFLKNSNLFTLECLRTGQLLHKFDEENKKFCSEVTSFRERCESLKKDIENKTSSLNP
ncbi:hypothetical protein MWN41_09920 [Ornithobacterium rhinotracheale]|uniref:hypothetical protein n=1 Tax=Ornithobacterium rhinotracheale TaxID=28251 RepID=UPI001FF248E6|nr:hypothetical protein [Ornithobacterium rhinotracheale]MCK0203327.1 hypothetical protein [Ornithobacterium rhinotracheale]